MTYPWQSQNLCHNKARDKPKSSLWWATRGRGKHGQPRCVGTVPRPFSPLKLSIISGVAPASLCLNYGIDMAGLWHRALSPSLSHSPSPSHSLLCSLSPPPSLSPSLLRSISPSPSLSLYIYMCIYMLALAYFSPNFEFGARAGRKLGQCQARMKPLLCRSQTIAKTNVHRK